MILALAAASPSCEAKEIGGVIEAALAARKGHDPVSAAAAIAPAAACPVRSAQAYGARVLAAGIAGNRADWPAVRQLLAGIAMHPEMTRGARLRFLLLRADQGLAEAETFAADRALTMIANDARLFAAGNKLEAFRLPGAEVTAFHTLVNQGGFHRMYEFVALPEDEAAYPVTVMLTDDQSTGAVMKQLGLNRGGARRA